MGKLRSIRRVTGQLRSMARCMDRTMRCLERMRDTNALSKAVGDLRLELKDVDREIARARRERDASGLRAVKTRAR